MAKFRKVIFWLHLGAGLVAGAVVFVMSVTGVLLMYERQTIAWAERGYRSAPPQPGATRLPLAALLDKARAALPEPAPTALTLRSDPAAPAAVAFGREKTLFINPYTGTALGEGAKGVRAFFRQMTDWHRWLGTGEANRATGRAITGACNLAFLFLVVSGFYLWWPRKWTKSALKSVSIPSIRLRSKARDFNWHNALGLWSAPILFFVVLTGVVMSYPWATNLLYRLTGNEPPPPNNPPPRAQPAAGNESPRRAAAGVVALPENLDALWARAEGQVPGWQSVNLRLPSSPAAPLVFTIDRGNGGRPDLRAGLTLDPRTGEVTKWEPFSSNNSGRQLRMWSRWVHTGEAGGLLGQTLAGLASLAACVLVYTGFALAWRRFFFKRPSRSLEPSPPLDEERARAKDAVPASAATS